MRYMFTVLLFLSSILNASSIGITAIFKNEGPYLEEWIEYHKEMGVTHFWLYNHYSTDNFREILQKYIDSGLVELEDLDCGHNDRVRNIQAQVYRRAIKSARLHVNWLAVIDIDEFLVPMKQKNLPDTLDIHFKNASLVYVNWRQFGTSSLYLNPSEKMIPNLTKCSLKTHPCNANGKGLIRLSDAIEDKMWSPHFCPVKGFVYYGDGTLFDGDGNPFSRELDLHIDGKHHDKFIRINHYFTRDENFWKNQKLPRIIARREQNNIEIFLQQYRDFLLIQDDKIINLLKKEHSKFWNDFFQ